MQKTTLVFVSLAAILTAYNGVAYFSTPRGQPQPVPTVPPLSLIQKLGEVRPYFAIGDDLRGEIVTNALNKSIRIDWELVANDQDGGDLLSETIACQYWITSLIRVDDDTLLLGGVSPRGVSFLESITIRVPQKLPLIGQSGALDWVLSNPLGPVESRDFLLVEPGGEAIACAVPIVDADDKYLVKFHDTKTLAIVDSQAGTIQKFAGPPGGPFAQQLPELNRVGDDGLFYETEFQGMCYEIRSYGPPIDIVPDPSSPVWAAAMLAARSIILQDIDRDGDIDNVFGASGVDMLYAGLFPIE
jgi:hypothetical protein